MGAYRKLPKSHKWPYFYHHFFWPIIVARRGVRRDRRVRGEHGHLAEGAGPRRRLVGVEESDRSMDKLEDGFLKYRALDEKKITFENDLYIDSRTRNRASMSLDTLETQMSGGTINTIIGDDSALRSQHLLGYLERLTTCSRLARWQLRERGALVTDGEGGAAKAIDLGKSAEWTRIKGRTRMPSSRS